MFARRYWSPRYWAGRYWAKTAQSSFRRVFSYLEASSNPTEYLEASLNLTEYLEASSNPTEYLEGGIDMTDTKRNFSLYKGETKSLFMRVTDKYTGELIDLSNVHLLYRVGTGPTAASYAVEKKLDDTHAQIVVVSTGVCRVDFTHDDSKSLDAKTWYHELAMTAASMDELLLTGDWVLNDRMTNVV